MMYQTRSRQPSKRASGKEQIPSGGFPPYMQCMHPMFGGMNPWMFNYGFPPSSIPFSPYSQFASQQSPYQNPMMNSPLVSPMRTEEQKEPSSPIVSTGDDIDDKMFKLQQSNAKLQNQITGLINILHGLMKKQMMQRILSADGKRCAKRKRLCKERRRKRNTK